MNKKDIIINSLREYPTFQAEDKSDKVDDILHSLDESGISYSSYTTTVGPTYTLIELTLEKNTRISNIKKWADDISLSMLASGIRVTVPTPEKSVVGIEFANRQQQIIGLGSLLQTPEYLDSSAVLPIIVGMDVTGMAVVADLSKMPHLLVAGATSQGKSVFLNTLIISLLTAEEPEELRFLLIDTKKVEFAQYSALTNSYLLKIDNLPDGIITENEDAKAALHALCAEMDRRYSTLLNYGARSITEYNQKRRKKLPYIVVVMDEYADLIMSLGYDFETIVARLAQKGCAVGIHVVMATQRQSKNVVTDLIKANFPARIAFRVSQNIDSKAILNKEGASQLLGRGDMLFLNNGIVTRLQGALVDSSEIKQLLNNIP